MSAERYTLDTNVLVYSVDKQSGPRHRLAGRVVVAAARDDCFLTLQTLAEFFTTVSRKNRMPVADAEAQVRDWMELFEVVCADGQSLQHAMRGMSKHRLSFWDALLWATAKRAGATRIVTEDFQSGQVLEGVEFYDPFQ